LTFPFIAVRLFTPNIIFTRQMPIATQISVLHIRNKLFDAAQDRHIHTEDALVVYLNEQKILWKMFDEKSILTMMSAIIKENNIKATPTCFIRYSATDVKKFVGDDEIWNGLTALKMHISAGKSDLRRGGTLLLVNIFASGQKMNCCIYDLFISRQMGGDATLLKEA